VVVVVRGWESQPHGEGPQVEYDSRDAGLPNDPARDEAWAQQAVHHDLLFQEGVHIIDRP
jgi:hypothetical protein